MRCMRALSTLQLMPAVSSRKVPVATPLLDGLPGKTERPRPLTRTSGTPSIIMSSDQSPWTQIRLGAGTRNADTRPFTGGRR